MDEMEKRFRLREEREKQRNDTIKKVQDTITKWKELKTLDKAIFVRTIPGEISFLPSEEQNIMVEELFRAGIFKKKELKKLVADRVNLMESIYGSSEDKEAAKKKKVGTKTLVPGLIHLVKRNGITAYLLHNEDSLYIENTIKIGDYEYQPKQNLPFYHLEEDILEESQEVDYSHLLKNVVEFIKSYLELPEEAGYLILALWVFHTYLIEKVNVSPIMYFFGLMETGKSRAGEVLQELAYKCERMTSPTEATLFRGAEHFRTTLVIDEVKLWGKGGNQEVARLIKSRYKRGLKVSRINLNLKGENQIEYFDVFAPLVIATTEAIPNIIESRCIRFIMQKNANPKVEKTIDTELAKDIRNKLTIFRAKYIDIGLKEVDDISRRRLNEILKPLYQILMEIEPKREDEFKSTVKGLEESKKSEEGFTDTAEIVKELDKLFNEENRTFIHATELTERLNKSKSSEDEKTNITSVGWKMRPLGFNKEIRGGKVGYIINTDTLSKLTERFNVPQSDNETDDEPDLFSS
jgi:hypothetical protein